MATRFAGSRAPTAGFDSTSGRGRDFSGLEITSSRVGSNAGSAADAVSLSNTYGALARNRADYGEISTTGNVIRSGIRTAGDKAEASLRMSGVSQYANVKQAEEERKLMAQQAAEAKKKAAFGVFGKVLGAGVSLATGGLGGGVGGLFG